MTVCGELSECLAKCPVMRLGRVCPDVVAFVDEIAAMGLLHAGHRVRDEREVVDA